FGGAESEQGRGSSRRCIRETLRDLKESPKLLIEDELWSEVFAAADRTELSSMSVIDPQNLASAPGGEASGNEIRCPGPGHSAEDRSLCVKVDPGAPDGFVVCTHAPPTTGVSAATTFGPRPAYDPFKPNSQRRYNGAGQPKGKIVVEYNYTDESRSLLYQVVRYYPKGLRWRWPDGSSGWIWSLCEKRRVLYRWPELLKYPDATVFVCEGEKDADRVASLEHCATTAAGGKWTDDCAKALAGRHVIILQ